MNVSRRQFLKMAGGAAASLVPLPLNGWQRVQSTNSPILHLLNRLTWGARPQDVEHANAVGYEAYLEEQLNPEQIDDSALDAILETMPVLQMDRRTVFSLIEPYYRSYQALIKGMIARAVHSERQLLERMVEFWSDHFNIGSGDLSPEMITFQRDVIRRHAMGSFRDMLLASAQSVAMLYYLDNYLNVAEHPNENYARELLELHTLGVDGGYTETDVYEVARAFTGWTINDASDTGFYFDPSVHDTDAKTILGHELPAGRGIEDGLHVIGIVNNHPETARFLCFKLCRRFVSDDPPESLVESAAQVWIETGGEIRPVLRHIFLSEEFRGSAGQKLRRPLDFFIGTLRATGTEVREFWALDEMLSDLAQVPYGWEPPDGYPDTAGAWMNSSGLLARWNIAMALTHGAFSDPDQQSIMTSHLIERVGEPATVGELVSRASEQVYGAPLNDLSPYIAFVSDGAGSDAPVTPHVIARKLGSLFGLLLAAPTYQWR